MMGRNVIVRLTGSYMCWWGTEPFLWSRESVSKHSKTL